MHTNRPVRLPTEQQIRARLSTLAREANTLRALLRVVRRDQKPAEPKVANATR